MTTSNPSGFQAIVWKLGGGGGERKLDEVTDMERIDPATVRLPRWYRPNPGRAAELAFIMSPALIPLVIRETMTLPAA